MKNDYEIRGKETAIFLRRKDGTVLETLIDTADLPKVQKFGGAWFASKGNKGRSGFYAAMNIRRNDGSYTLVLLHRVITGAPKGYDVDHRNHDTLDNRSSNLRIVTRAENHQNRKGA